MQPLQQAVAAAKGKTKAQSHPARAPIHGAAFYAGRDSRYAKYRTRAAKHALMHIALRLKIGAAIRRPRLPSVGSPYFFSAGFVNVKSENCDVPWSV